MAEGDGIEISSRRIHHAVAASELWGGLLTRTRQKPLGAKGVPQLTTSKELGPDPQKL